MTDVLFKYHNGDCSEIFEDFLSNINNDVCINFEKEDYYFSRKVVIKNKNHLFINGNDATVISEFNPAAYENYTGIFHFENCADIKIANFNIETSEPVNPGGKIVAVNNENRNFDVKLYENISFDGTQRIIGMNSMDSDGTPDDMVYTTNANGFSYKINEDNTIRIFYEPKGDKQIKTGGQICLRHAIGSFKRLNDSAFTFKNCTDIVIENFTVYSSVYFLFVFFPRCHNLTLKKVYVGSPKQKGCLMGTNIDAVHVLGLTGKLTIKDCVFSGLGDDALNIHSSAYTVTNLKSNEAELVHRRNVGQAADIPTNDCWCQKGDKIIIYNPDFSKKGSLTAEKFNNGKLIFSELNGKLEAGDILANSSFYAEVEIDNCIFENSRARALLIQTENVLIKNCRFFGMFLPAILISPDIEHWSEVGPAENVNIENCTFEKCGTCKTGLKKYSILSSCCHDSDKDFPYNVHKNITIRNNKFLNAGGICLNSTTGVKIENNQFIDCNSDSIDELVVLKNCRESVITENILKNKG